MEKLEQSAYILYAAKQLGKIKPLSDEDLKKLLSLKAEYNYKSWESIIQPEMAWLLTKLLPGNETASI